MKFLKKLLLLITAVIVLGLAALLYLLSRIPVFEPCEPFESYFGADTISFPIEGNEAKLKFGGMRYDSLPPYFLYALRGDTLIRMHFRAGYDEGRFNKSGKDTATKWHGQGYTIDYDAKGIYNYSFILTDKAYQKTLERFHKLYGSHWEEKISKYHQNPFIQWEIGPCHHLLLFKKKPFSEYQNLKKSEEYTYIMFVYNVSEREINDMVEIEGAIRNDFFF